MSIDSSCSLKNRFLYVTCSCCHYEQTKYCWLADLDAISVLCNSINLFFLRKKLLLQNMSKMDKMGAETGLFIVFQECCYCLFFLNLAKMLLGKGVRKIPVFLIFFEKINKEETLHIVTILMTWEELLILILGKIDQKRLK